MENNRMIPKNTSYKLVVDGIIIAAGSKKDMIKLQEKIPNSKIWLTDKNIGESVQ
jgi:hypothetical protein